MEKLQKLVVTLLIVTIILSVISLSINLIFLKSNLKTSSSNIIPLESGNINLVVERSTSSVESIGSSNG